MLISISFLLAYRFSMSTIYIALELTVSSFISVTMKLDNSYNNKFYYHGHLISVNISQGNVGNNNGVLHKRIY